MTAQNLDIFQHPRLSEIQNYSAIRLGCDVDILQRGSHRIAIDYILKFFPIVIYI